MRLKSIGATAAILAGITAAGAQETGDPFGLWITNEGKGQVEVKACGEKLCGKIVWLREPTDANGQPLRDHRNEDESKRERKIIGLPVMMGLEASGPAAWRGYVYSPERGKAFEVDAVQTAPDRLELTGCGLGGLICETHIWTRGEVQASTN